MKTQQRKNTLIRLLNETAGFSPVWDFSEERATALDESSKLVSPEHASVIQTMIHDPHAMWKKTPQRCRAISAAIYAADGADAVIEKIQDGAREDKVADKKWVKDAIAWIEAKRDD